MRIYRRFLICLSFFLFSVVVSSSALAQEDLPAIVKRISPSVVVILTYDEEEEAIGQGSGFFINDKGDVITNRHVLEGASRADVKTADGKVYPVSKVLAEDREGDLIQVSVDIPREAVRPLSVSTTPVEAGEKVAVIGSPLGLELTVSDGIVSAVRDIPMFGKIIQLTAPMSEGSSGSPVVNMKGEVIGVATFQVVEGQSLNFAISGERVLNLKPDKGQTIAEWQAGELEELLTSAEVLHFTGLLFLWGEDCEEALFYFEEAVKQNPNNAETYFFIGYCYDELGLYKEAVEAYKKAILIKPDDAVAYTGLGAVYSELELYKEAVEAYKKAARIKPNDAEAHLRLGTSYAILGLFRKAIEALKQAIRIKPDYAKVHFTLGWVYLSLGDKDSALQEYKILKDLDRDLANTLFDLIYE